MEKQTFETLAWLNSISNPSMLVISTSSGNIGLIERANTRSKIHSHIAELGVQCDVCQINYFLKNFSSHKLQIIH